MCAAPKSDSSVIPQWQADYVREFQRTSGKIIQFVHQGNGWWRLDVIEGEPDRIGGRYRRGQIMAMTARLRGRPAAVVS